MEVWLLIGAAWVFTEGLIRYEKQKVDTVTKQCNKTCPNYPNSCCSKIKVSGEGRMWREDFFSCKEVQRQILKLNKLYGKR
jgi:hypothetical protein